MGFFLPADATFRRLTFNDFLTVNRQPPAPGTTATAAQTRVGHRLQPNTFTFRRSSFLPGGVFTMQEDPNVFVDLQARQSAMFAASWVFQRPQTFQDELLNHEQGHYEIGMLNAKDFFFELQRIQASSFPTARAGVAAMRNLQATLGNAQAIHNKYERYAPRSQSSEPGGLGRSSERDAGYIHGPVTPGRTQDRRAVPVTNKERHCHAQITDTGGKRSA